MSYTDLLQQQQSFFSPQLLIPSYDGTTTTKPTPFIGSISIQAGLSASAPPPSSTTSYSFSSSSSSSSVGVFLTIATGSTPLNDSPKKNQNLPITVVAATTITITSTTTNPPNLPPLTIPLHQTLNVSLRSSGSTLSTPLSKSAPHSFHGALSLAHHLHFEKGFQYTVLADLKMW